MSLASLERAHQVSRTHRTDPQTAGETADGPTAGIAEQITARMSTVTAAPYTGTNLLLLLCGTPWHHSVRLTPEQSNRLLV